MSKTFDDRSLVQNRWRIIDRDGVPGSWSLASTSMVGLSGLATYESHRPKPSPTTPTFLRLQKMDWEFGGAGSSFEDLSYGRKREKQGTWYYAQSALPSSPDDHAQGIAPTAKLLSSMSDASLGEAIGEFGQSVNMVLNRIDSIYQLFKALKNGNPRGLSRALKRSLRRQSPSSRLANGYLEVKYGWLPLLGDVHDAMNALNSSLSSGKGRSVVKRVREVIKDGDAKITVRAGLRGKVTQPVLYNLNRYGLLNPFDIAWNLLPWTFVFDWFIPVGTVLGALYGTAGLKVTSSWGTNGYQTVRYRIGQFDGDRRIYFRETDIYRRQVPLNPFAVNWGNASLNTGQILSALALAKQRLR